MVPQTITQESTARAHGQLKSVLQHGGIPPPTQLASPAYTMTATNHNGRNRDGHKPRPWQPQGILWRPQTKLSLVVMVVTVVVIVCGRVLGVKFDRLLRFTEHAKYVTEKAQRRLNVLEWQDSAEQHGEHKMRIYEDCTFSGYVLWSRTGVDHG